MTRRRAGLALGAAALLIAGAAVTPVGAWAHGLSGRADLPVPTWLFGWAAAIVLAVSFVALSSLWREPRLQEPELRPLFRVPVVVDVVCGALGVALFGLLVYAGLHGVKDADHNILTVWVYVIFWVGLAVASVLFGNVFRLFNPWRSVAVGARSLARGRGWRTRQYPPWLGRWPAAAGILGFAWLELVYTKKTDPQILVWIVIAYALVQLVGMAVYGIEEWGDRADAFGVYFGMFALLSPWERRDGVLNVRRPLSGAPRWLLVPGGVALLCVSIGSTSFDGLENGALWSSLDPHLRSLFGSQTSTTAIELSATIGLLGMIAVVALFYRLGINGMHTVDREHSGAELRMRFVHTLIPIAFAYALAHYFSFLLYKGQEMGYLISDPLGHGSNIFGTARATVDFGIISGSGIWYVQVGALICGHVAGLMLAHDRAIAMYRRADIATRSQYWMLVVMVGFTSLGLWLLSAVNQR